MGTGAPNPGGQARWLYGGIDGHETYLIIAVVDKNGEVVREVGRVPAGDGEALLKALEGYRPLEVEFPRLGGQ